MAVDQKPRFVKGPSPTPCYIPLCRGLSLHVFVASAWYQYGHAPQKKLVAQVRAYQEILLQAYVAEWPPKLGTNPMLLIHSHMKKD